MKKYTKNIRAALFFVIFPLLSWLFFQKISAGVVTSITINNDMLECISVIQLSAESGKKIKTDLQQLSIDQYDQYFSSMLAHVSQTALLEKYSYKTEIFSISDPIEITLTYTLSGHVIPSKNILLLQLPDFAYLLRKYCKDTLEVTYEMELPGYELYNSAKDSPWSQASMTVISNNKFSYTKKIQFDLDKTVDNSYDTAIVTEEWLVFIRRER